MPDDLLLRERAWEAIRSGQCPHVRLIVSLHRRRWSELSCRVCGEPVKRDELEVEIQFGRLDPTLGLDVFSFTRGASQRGSLSGRSYRLRLRFSSMLPTSPAASRARASTYSYTGV